MPSLFNQGFLIAVDDELAKVTARLGRVVEFWKRVVMIVIALLGKRVPRNLVRLLGKLD